MPEVSGFRNGAVDLAGEERPDSLIDLVLLFLVRDISFLGEFKKSALVKPGAFTVLMVR
jgi:hypothetical protein